MQTWFCDSMTKKIRVNHITFLCNKSTGVNTTRYLFLLHAPATSSCMASCNYFWSISTEFCREVTDIQMPHVAPVILPEMYKIFIHAEVCWQMLCYVSSSTGEKWNCDVIMFCYIVSTVEHILLFSVSHCRLISLQVYSIRTRSRAADIFNTCASLICAMEDDNTVRIILNMRRWGRGDVS